MAKPDEQHQFDLLYMPHNLFGEYTHKYILIEMLHQDIKLRDHLGLKNQAKLHLSRKQSIKRVVCLNIPRPSSKIMHQSLKMK